MPAATTAYLPNRDGNFVETRIPKYVIEALKNIKPAPAAEQINPGYTYRLYRPDNFIYLGTVQKTAEALTAWARRLHADSFVHSVVTFTDKEHRKPYYKRDYILFVMTDPVALQLEKVGFLK